MTKEKAQSYFVFSEAFNKYDESLTSIKNQEGFVYVYGHETQLNKVCETQLLRSHSSRKWAFRLKIGLH